MGGLVPGRADAGVDELHAAGVDGEGKALAGLDWALGWTRATPSPETVAMVHQAGFSKRS
jgi:hypothetical protein